MVGQLQTTSAGSHSSKTLVNACEFSKTDMRRREPEPANSSSHPSNQRVTGIDGWRTCRIGASHDSCGGATEYRHTLFASKAKTEMSVSSISIP